MSKIEWTEQTWNPIVGCTIATPGCTNCYAMKMANRLANNPATPHYAGTVRKVNGNPVWTGRMAMAPDRILTAPLRRRKPTTYFVNSMGDLFHEDVPDEWIDRVFAVMALCPHHTFQVLTKRAERMREYMARGWVSRIHVFDQKQSQINEMVMRLAKPLPNVLLGVSVEDKARADERIPHLLGTPAAVRFISAEPLLGPIDLRSIKFGHMMAISKLDWVIVGGESGPNARPMHPEWARSLRDQCQAADVPLFFKQWGEWEPWPDAVANDLDAERNDMVTYFQDHSGTPETWMRRVGKKSAGRTLDGVVHDGRPG